MDRNIICMKWGTKYGPEYVNRLAKMVRAHLTGNYRFVCFTDDSTGIDSGIEIFPIPPMDLDPAAPERGWKKLTILANPLQDLKGQALFLDVDIVITGSLEPFFEYPGEFVIIHDWQRPHRMIGNSSVFRFKIGAHVDVLHRFETDRENATRGFRNEQAYLTDAVRRTTPVTFWPADWCVSFKAHCIPRFPLNFFRQPTLPVGARILVFHGHPKPDEAIAGQGRKWRRFKPCPWVAPYWDIQ